MILPIENEKILARGYGLAADYLSEILHRLRSFSYEALVDELFEFEGNYTIRDEKAIRKLLSGILKVLYPHGEFDKSELHDIARVVVGLRQNVVDILSEMAPHEFPSKRLGISVRG